VKSRRVFVTLLSAVLIAVPLAGLEATVTAGAAGAEPFISSYTDPTIVAPDFITAGPDGALWFTNPANNSIGRITTAGAVTNFTDPGISGPVGITAGPDGALWFTNFNTSSGSSSIGRITTAGTVSTYTDPSINFPSSIATGPDGALWFTNFNNDSIGRITSAGAVTNFTATGISRPSVITSGPDGALWFTNNGTSSTTSSIGRITTAGVVTNYTDSAIVGAGDIAVGPDGALWFTNYRSSMGNVIGTSIGRITTAGAVSDYPLVSTSVPVGIAPGSDGALWFTNFGGAPPDSEVNHRSIGRITTAGTVTDYTDPTITGPNHIAAGPDGAMWFTNTSNSGSSIGRITVLTPPGVPTIGNATPGTGSATVTFTAPASDGGSAITGFTASCVSSDGGVSGTGTATGSPVVVAGLSNGNTYTCTVTATNELGTSAPSAPSNAVVVGAPGAPVGVSVMPAPGSATVAWTAPPENAAPIDQYDVSCASSDGGATGQATATASPQAITGLTNGNTYTCSVTATNASGTGPAGTSAPFVDGELPDAPTIGTATRGDASATVSFTAGPSNGNPILDFTASCTSSNGGSGSSATGGSSPITVSALTIAKTYTCVVTERTAVGTSPASAASNAFVAATVPTAPTIGAATRGNASASVTFTASSNGASPVLHFDATCTSTNGGVSGSASRTVSPISVTALTNGKTYTCSVTATNAIGTSAPSGASNAVVPATVPGRPTAPSATPGSASATVAWTAPANNGAAFTGYIVTPYLGGVAQPARTFNSSATAEIVTGLANTKSYTFRVAARNSVGIGPTSVATSPILVGLPTAPTNVRAVGGNGRATVSWAAPVANGGSAITGYAVTPYVGTTAQAKRVFTSTATSEGITGLTNGTAYTFKVAALNSRGTGLQSAPMTPITVGSPKAPSAPRILSIVPGNGKITLTWAAPTSNGSASVSGYVVTPYIGGVAQPIRSFNAATTQTVTGLTNGTVYTFKVQAGNNAGLSPLSAASSPMAAGAPVAPTGVNATSGVASATVHWTAPANNGSGITGYVITPYKGGVAQPARTFASTATTEVVSGLTSGASYRFKVAAKNSRGTGPQSAASNAVTPS
jgi:trimeric autotransporter adhesin